MQKLIRSIKYAECLQMAQALQTGTVTFNYAKGANITYNYGMKASHLVSYTGDNRWNQRGTSATGKPLDNLKAAKRLIRQDGKTVAKCAIMGQGAWDSFISHPDVIALGDNRRIAYFESMKLNEPAGVDMGGFEYQGYYGDAGLHIYVADERIAHPDNNTDQLLIDTNKVIVMGENVGVSAYGAVAIKRDQNSPADIYVGEYVPRVYGEFDPDTDIIQVFSSPLKALQQPDAVVTLTVN